jgi:hypothetical protein
MTEGRDLREDFEQEGAPRPGEATPVADPPETTETTEEPKKKSFLWIPIAFMVGAFLFFWFGYFFAGDQNKVGVKKDVIGALAPTTKAPEVPTTAPVAAPTPSPEAANLVAKGLADRAEDMERQRDERNDVATQLAEERDRLTAELAKAEKRSQKLLAESEARERAAFEATQLADAAVKVAERDAERAASVLDGSRDAEVLGLDAPAQTMKSEHYQLKGTIGGPNIAPAVTSVSEPEACTKKGGPRYAEFFPRLDENEVILSGVFPAGGVLEDVEVYDDVRGIPTRHLGAVSCFTLKRGAGFNFVWRDQEGHRHYQMITPQSSRLLVGTGLDVDCSNLGGCKYIRP